ncbi:hypothetical protein IE077_001769 [Cardiosporidium cionae]|uniref:BUD13 homolog n=1 Tax=Cardiosporidium cionae TaxID=476202 RepID=A0ABQ7JCE6_9APIC|nr:hypothetical protein IE077_001769 [Cardiosporidium cionae]|eukprot:KAF8821651.1 hypothetical protein IE077_001769 [Cardiosporidium cionae]
MIDPHEAEGCVFYSFGEDKRAPHAKATIGTVSSVMQRSRAARSEKKRSSVHRKQSFSSHLKLIEEEIDIPLPKKRMKTLLGLPLAEEASSGEEEENQPIIVDPDNGRSLGFSTYEVNNFLKKIRSEDAAIVATTASSQAGGAPLEVARKSTNQGSAQKYLSQENNPQCREQYKIEVVPVELAENEKLCSNTRWRDDFNKDLSPPRRRKEEGERDLSPPRRRKDEKERYLSPPRRRMEEGERDLSLLRRRKGEKERDLSPPRRRMEEVERDLSPPRRRMEEGEKDLSPPRRRKERDLSPSRRRKEEVERDLSPPRRRKEEVERDLSPPHPRRGEKERDLAQFSYAGGSGDEDISYAFETKREPMADASSSMTRSRVDERDHPPAVESGDAPPAVIYRNKEGKVISRAEWLKLEEKKKKRKKEKVAPQVLEWGTGLVQKQEAVSRQQEEAKLAKEPLARYEIDKEMDGELRNQQRWGDPMLKALNETIPEKKDQMAENKSPVCRFPAPPNRFHIKPGYRWDGVVRGNGFEERRILEIHKSKHEKAMAHMWNVADM